MHPDSPRASAGTISATSRYRRAARVVLVVGVIALVLGGCRGLPDDAGTDEPGAGSPGGGGTPGTPPDSSRIDEVSTGGPMTLTVEGGVQVDIPAGAIPAGRNIELISHLDAPPGQLPDSARTDLWFSIEADGELTGDVTLSVPAPDEEASWSLAYFDPILNIWVPEPTDRVEGRLVATVDHFTDFTAVRTAIDDAVNEAVGEVQRGADWLWFQAASLAGLRTGQPTCPPSSPDWVKEVFFADGANQPLLGCTFAAGAELVVRLSANRDHPVLVEFSTPWKRTTTATTLNVSEALALAAHQLTEAAGGHTVLVPAGETVDVVFDQPPTTDPISASTRVDWVGIVAGVAFQLLQSEGAPLANLKPVTDALACVADAQAASGPELSDDKIRLVGDALGAFRQCASTVARLAGLDPLLYDRVTVAGNRAFLAAGGDKATAAFLSRGASRLSAWWFAGELWRWELVILDNVVDHGLTGTLLTISQRAPGTGEPGNSGSLPRGSGRLSIAPGGGDTSGGSIAGPISDDGRWVIFASSAPEYGGSSADEVLVLADRRDGTVSALGGTAGVDSSEIAISGDGSTLFYGQDTPETPFGGSAGVIRDRETGSVEVLRGPDGDVLVLDTLANTSVSSGGRYVLFATNDQVLSELAQNRGVQTYRYDRANSAYEIVSVNNQGIPGEFGSRPVSLSDDGNSAFFSSDSYNLPDQTTARDGRDNIYQRNMITSSTTRLRLTAPNYEVGISASGRWTASIAGRTMEIVDQTSGELATVEVPVDVDPTGFCPQFDTQT